MKRSLFLLLTTTVLASCSSPPSSSGAGPGTSPYPPTATKSPVQDSSAIAQRKDDVVTAYFFVKKIQAGGSLGAGLNGFPSTLSITFAPDMVANLLVGEAIKLELLPGQTYPFSFKNTFYQFDATQGTGSLNLQTGGANTWVAYEISEPTIIGTTLKLQPLSWNEVQSRLQRYTFVEPHVNRTALALKPTPLPESWQQCSQQADPQACQQGVLETLPASLVNADAKNQLVAITENRWQGTSNRSGELAQDNQAADKQIAGAGPPPPKPQAEPQPTAASDATTAPQISYRDPLFAPLNGIDLTQFKRVGEGLRLIGSKGEYELLLTEPGHPAKVSKHDFGGIDWNRTDQFLDYSGYMLRWKKNTDEPVPYIGRLTFPTDDGRKKIYTGAFDARYYRKKLFSETNRNPKVFLEGLVTAYNTAGNVTEQVYRVNRYAVTYIGPDRDVRFYAMADATHRQLLIAPSEAGRKPRYTTASALPEYEFVLPRPERLMAQSGWGDDRELFTREFSLAALLKAHKINPDQLLMPELKPRKEKLGGRGQSTFIGHRAWVNKGQAAFLHSATTGKTYLQPYQQQAALTLPSVKEIVINGQLSVNRQCMGKSDGMVVLSGQCDPAAPAFPLTVMTQISATQYSINVWSDIDRRSSYLLTGGQFPKEAFYRWSIDAFMVDEPVDPEATIATLATGDDPFSQTLIAFANRGADQQVCDKLSAAADSAARALELNPDIEGRLADYKQYGLDMDWRSMGIAIDRIKPGNTPVTDFRKYVWDDLVAMEKDLKQRLSLLQRYQGVSNSACQPDTDRMTGLVAALSRFQQSLAGAMDKLDETYYAEAIALEKEIYYWSGRLEQAKRDAAVAAFFSKLESSLNAEGSAKQQERASIQRSQREARQLISAQIDDVKSRNAAFLTNTSPVVAAPGGSKISPVAMPAKPVDSATASKIYIGAAPSGRLSTREAIAQAQAKTKRLAQENQPTASKLSESSAPTAATEPARGSGGAAICVAVGRNSANNRTDIEYFYAYERQRSPLNVERQARQKHAAAHSGTPSCRHNRDGQLGALVVVVWQGQDYTGAPSRTYGMGFGPSLGAAEKDAVENLANRNWAWTSVKGYQLEFAKQY